MKYVFTLQHYYTNEYGYDEFAFIGVYTSEEEAQQAIERLKLQPGFSERPDDFCIDKYELNVDHWAEGFYRIETLWVRKMDNEWVPAHAKVKSDGIYELLETADQEFPVGFKFKDLVKCEERNGELYAVETVKK